MELVSQCFLTNFKYINFYIMKDTKFENIVGMDISKATFDVALLINNKLDDSNKFSNDLKGFEKLLLWLKSKNISTNKILFCAEKSGLYSYKLAKYMIHKKYNLWLEDPIKISMSEGFKRGKSDKIDAVRIAKYALRFIDNLKLFKANEAIYDKMNYLFSLRERLITVLGIIETPLNESKEIFDSKFQKVFNTICLLPILHLKRSIKKVDKKLDDLLEEDVEINKKYKIASSVKGIGRQTAIYLLIISRGFTKIKTSRKCSCYSGIAPFEYSSGTSVKGKTKVSRFGNKKLKKLLYMGAISIIAHKKGEEYDYYCRKVSEGKHKMKVINALKNKMLSRVFACIRENREYEKNYIKKAI